MSGYLFAVLALVVARPVAIALSFVGTRLPWQEQAAVAWFGPKGFASVVYGLIMLDSGASRADEMFHLMALAVVLSIVAHSSTDVPIAHYFARARARSPQRDDEQATLNCEDLRGAGVRGPACRRTASPPRVGGR